MKHIYYVATIVIKRVEIEDAKTVSGNYNNPGVMQGRKVGDIASIVVRASELEKLKQQVKDHLLIVDDDTAIPLDDTSGGTKR